LKCTKACKCACRRALCLAYEDRKIGVVLFDGAVVGKDKLPEGYYYEGRRTERVRTERVPCACRCRARLGEEKPEFAESRRDHGGHGVGVGVLT